MVPWNELLQGHMRLYALPTGLEKRYTLNCLESEIMQASVDKESLPTYLLAEASELSRWAPQN